MQEITNLKYTDALNLILESAAQSNLEMETVSIDQCLNRILAANIFCGEDIPSFHNSAMDGYAIKSENSLSASPETPVRLEILQTIAAGDSKQVRLEDLDKTLKSEKFCVEIMTGAPVPEVFDAVVKIEDVKFENSNQSNESRILLTKSVQKFENIRFKGEDFKKEDLLLEKGTMLMPEHLMGLAALGVSNVNVFKKPKIFILSTGREVVDYKTQKLNFAQVRNSNSLFLKEYLNLMGCEVEDAGIIHDDPEEFLRALNRIEKSKPDVIVSTGAVSMGKYDFVKASLLNSEAEIIFHKVKIRPGKPILFAKLKSGAKFFGLPGNPIATAVGARFFLTPYIKKLQGQQLESPMKAHLLKGTKKPSGLRCFFKAQIDLSNQSIKSLTGQSSSMISPFIKSNAWVVFPEDGDNVPENAKVEYYFLNPYPNSLKVFHEGSV